MAMNPTDAICVECGNHFVQRTRSRLVCSIECSFLQKIRHIRKDSASCWEWSGAHLSSGYGKLSYGKTQDVAHRVSYRTFRGAIPDGLVVCHTCDNKKCVNPAHMFLGTLKDNNYDCIQKNRHVVGRIGTEHSMAKLSESDVREIRDLIASKVMQQKDIAKAYGITPSNLCHIKTRKLWGHI